MKRLFSLALILVILCIGNALADANTLSVNGSGTVYMQADQVNATLGITLSGKDLSQIQNQVNETVANICAAMIAAGLDENSISTNYIYISPCYDYSSEGNHQELIGYTINNSLSIRTVNADAIGEYIDAAFAAGANTFDSIDFSLQDDSDARDRALEIAVESARHKAEVIAAASGKELGDIVEINEINSDSYYYGNDMGKTVWTSEAVDAGSATAVRAAQVSVTSIIEIVYELK